MLFVYEEYWVEFNGFIQRMEVRSWGNFIV